MTTAAIAQFPVGPVANDETHDAALAVAPETVHYQLPHPARAYLQLLEADSQGPRRLDDLTTEARRRTDRRVLIVQEIQRIAKGDGLSATAAAETLIELLETGKAPPKVAKAARACARGKAKHPSRASLLRWVKDFEKGGALALADQHHGRKREWYGWEPLLLWLWLQPTKPTGATVALWLRENHGFESATRDRVYRFINALPEHLGKNSPYRTGRHYYNQNIKPHKIRDYGNIPVGFVYEGDGHTCDFYVAHPRTGTPWRPELTPWIDWRSHYVVSWTLWHSESAVNTLVSLAQAILGHGHVPHALHVDPGSGFINHLISDRTHGYCARNDIEVMESLPGNAKGKGLVEGWFRIFEERVGKQFTTYCGHCRTDNELSRLRDKVKRGEIELPSLEYVIAVIARAIEIYNNTPQESLGNRTPAEVWAELQPCPPVREQDVMVRERVERTVRRWRLRIHNRQYEHEVLAEHEGRTLFAEYALTDMSQVDVFDRRGRYLCTAHQVEKTPALPDSRIRELQDKRLKHQIERKERAIEEDKARAGLAVTHDQVLDDIEALDAIDENRAHRQLEHGERIDLLGELLNEEGAGEPAPGSARDE